MNGSEAGTHAAPENGYVSNPRDEVIIDFVLHAYADRMAAIEENTGETRQDAGHPGHEPTPLPKWGQGRNDLDDI